MHAKGRSYQLIHHNNIYFRKLLVRRRRTCRTGSDAHAFINCNDCGAKHPLCTPRFSKFRCNTHAAIFDRYNCVSKRVASGSKDMISSSIRYLTMPRSLYRCSVNLPSLLADGLVSIQRVYHQVQWTPQ